MKTIARNHRYPLHVRWSEEDDAYLGSIPGLIGECCHADSAEGVVSQLQDIAEDLVEHLRANGTELPQVPENAGDPDPVLIRSAMGVSQSQFSRMIGVSVKTLHKWEQKTSRPSGAARTLLRVAAIDPEVVKRSFHGR